MISSNQYISGEVDKLPLSLSKLRKLITEQIISTPMQYEKFGELVTGACQDFYCEFNQCLISYEKTKNFKDFKSKCQRLFNKTNTLLSCDEKQKTYLKKSYHYLLIIVLVMVFLNPLNLIQLTKGSGQFLVRLACLRN